MKWLLLVLLAVQTPTPNPSPLPGHGRWEGKNVICYRGETQLQAKPKGRVHCACKAPCDESAAIDPGCQTACAQHSDTPQCVCHADECPQE
jgi:hypothetical protein